MPQKKPPADGDIPDKLYFKIGEVSKIAGLPAYVLRFWESEFSIIRPKRTPTGSTAAQTWNRFWKSSICCITGDIRSKALESISLQGKSRVRATPPPSC